MKEDTLEVPRREEMSTVQVKNIALHLNGQNLCLTAKNGRHSKIPGRHLSATHGEETAGQLTAPSPQLDSPPRLESPGQAGKGPMRRPLKLAPLSDHVVKIQRKKLQSLQRETRVSSPTTKTLKGDAIKISACCANPPQTRPSRPQLTRLEARRVRLKKEQHLEEDQAEAFAEEGKLEVRGARCMLGNAQKCLLDI